MSKKVFSDKKAGLFFWFIFPTLLLITFYHPFEQPILIDRAYLLYMSQVVFRGELLYEQTTFGYTPFSTLIVGYLMKLGSIFSLSTIETARIFGILFYGCICSAFYLLAKSIWNKTTHSIIACILFTGLDYIAILSGINAEPKLWVLFFSILGLLHFHKQHWLLCGLFFSLASMCWHLAVISLFAVGFTLILLRANFWSRLRLVLAGVFLGTLPTILYLSFTNQWLAFWQQAVLRKINIEANVIGESPFEWLFRSIYPAFFTEIFHFILGALGFMILFFQIIKKAFNSYNSIKSSATTIFLLVYTLMWSGFNTIEFQTNVDFFPLVPIIIIFSVYFLTFVFTQRHKFGYILGFGTLILYSYYNAIYYQIPYSFTQQHQTFSRLDKQFGNGMAVGFVDYYTVLEKPTPTKFVRFVPYEETMLKHTHSCQSIIETLKTQQVSYIIEFDASVRKRSALSNKLFNLFGIKITKDHRRMKCIEHIINANNHKKGHKSFEIIMEKIPFKTLFYDREFFFVYPIDLENM
ncbi:hypothetical protein BKI52_45245 [marine bacterium AO1-C]|nr:hypothetical protein BKI52_45245 [marine bacterium AO1-C]